MHKTVPPIQINVKDVLALHKPWKQHICRLKHFIETAGSLTAKENTYWIFKEEWEKAKHN